MDGAILIRMPCPIFNSIPLEILAVKFGASGMIVQWVNALLIVFNITYMGSGREEWERYVLSKFGLYSFCGLWDIYFKLINGRSHSYYLYIIYIYFFNLQIPLTTLIPCTKFRFYILNESIFIAFYRFSLKGILWAWQYCDFAHLQYQPA